MIEKKIEKVKLNDLNIFEAIILDEEPVDDKIKILTPLNGFQFLDISYSKYAIIFFEPFKDVDVFGINHKLRIGRLPGVSSYLCRTLTELRKKNKEVYEYVVKNLEPMYLSKYNEALLRKREAYKAKIQKQYDELLEVYTSFGYKSDIATMKDIDNLLYCEAEGFMNKIEERIQKKNNPKNMKIYKALMTLRDNQIITCEE